MNTHELRTLITDKIDIRWSEWSQEHPHLAEAIDRVQLIESTVRHLNQDPDFIAAMREADLDGADLIRASRALDRAEGLIQRILPL